MKKCTLNPVRKLSFALLGLIFLTFKAFAAPLSGVVNDADGAAVEGVMVTLISADGLRSVTRYSDAQGAYSFENIADDISSVRFRLNGFSDKTIALVEPITLLNAVMQPAGKDELLQQLPAHVWAERIGKTDDNIRREFRVQCMMCHQQGYPTARWAKTPEQWNSIYDRMAHKKALLTPEARKVMTDELIKAYNVEGDLGMPRVPPAPTGKATQVEISEWRLGDPMPSMHDVAVGPDKKIYGVDTIESHIWRLDPTTNEIEVLKHLYPKNREEGARLLLHTVFQAPDGKMWFTYAAGNLVASLDVYTEEMKVYEISYTDGIYPHTMRFDQDGQLWFTVTITNQLGTIDPITDEVVLYDIPTRNWKQSLVSWPLGAAFFLWAQEKFEISEAGYDELMPIAYGIDVTPDGKIWISQFNNRRIAAFDKKAETFEMIDTPFGGPRRFRADSKGVLWIPAFTDGLIYSYDPATEVFTPFEMPTGKGDSTYALAVDPKDDTVWACGSNSDTMMHLLPKTGEVITYQFPTHVTFCRELSFSEDGSVWTSYSNYPSFSIEGASSTFVRIRPLHSISGKSTDSFEGQSLSESDGDETESGE